MAVNTHGSGHETEAEEIHTHHIVPLSTYYVVFTALMVLLIITLAAAAVDLPGPLNIIIAMTIAVVKALLVVLYFMHVRYSSRLVQTFAGAAILWLVIMFSITFTDYMSRGLFPALGK